MNIIISFHFIYFFFYFLFSYIFFCFCCFFISILFMILLHLFFFGRLAIMVLWRRPRINIKRKIRFLFTDKLYVSFMRTSKNSFDWGWLGCAYFSTQIFYILICWCSLNRLFQKKNCPPPHVKNINFFEVNPLNFQSILSMILPLDFSFFFLHWPSLEIQFSLA